MREIPENLEQELEQGRRIVGIGYYGGIWTEENVLPSRIHMLYTVVLEDRIRKNAKKTLEFFKEQGVDVKIISGDHVKTVSMTGQRSGLKKWREDGEGLFLSQWSWVLSGLYGSFLSFSSFPACSRRCSRFWG